MKMTLKELREAASEMRTTMQIDEAIPSDATAEDVIMYISEASKLIIEGDQFSEETQSIIDFVSKEEAKENDDVDDDDIEVMKEYIHDAEKLSDLRSIVKYREVFATMRPTMTKYKDVEKLRVDMLNLLNGADYDPSEEEEPEEVPATEEEPEEISGINKLDAVDNLQHIHIEEKAEKEKPVKKTKVKKQDTKTQKKPAQTSQEERRATIPPKVKHTSYSRFDAACEALKTKNPQTRKQWVEETDKLCVANGGVSNLPESKRRVLYASYILKNFDIDFPKK